MRVTRTERKRIYRLRDKYGITTQEARAAYLRNGRSTKKAGEEIRLQLLFRLKE